MIRFKILLLPITIFPLLFTKGEKIDFSKEVLPILSNKCFACHGPDTKEEKLVRLDLEDLAKKDLGGYHAIDPSNLEESELLYRIVDQGDPMPPEDFGKTLTKNEKEVIRKWVMSGAEYAQHWSFVPPTKAGFELKMNPIDHFIGMDLEKKGIGFAEDADRATLARRASLVLNGLPPEPEELKSFLEDESANAYEGFLDSLFEKIDYGEHAARYWLDAVRYGDTHGLHLDNRRGIYPYRDWVVRSFNNNQPIDEFIQWQLAGDLFSEPTEEQLIATGYVRMNPTTGEGGAIPAEFQAKNNFDRAETTGTALLGLSLTCARCHTHKYDPITHQEYFEFLAFFNNTAEHSMDGNKYEYGDHITVSKDPESKLKWEELLNREKSLFLKVNDSKKYAAKDYDLATLAGLLSPDLSEPSSKVEGSSKNNPRHQSPRHAIDDNIKTKYLNRDAKGSGLTIHTPGGVINGISLTSAEDIPGRDPSSYRLEGSVNGKDFTLISEGEVPNFENEIKHEIFLIIRILQILQNFILKLADIYAKEMQISEIELLKSNVASPDELLNEAKALHIEMLEGGKFSYHNIDARELPESRKRITKVLNRGEYSRRLVILFTRCIFCSWLNAQECSRQQNGFG